MYLLHSYRWLLKNVRAMSRYLDIVLFLTDEQNYWTKNFRKEKAKNETKNEWWWIRKEKIKNGLFSYKIKRDGSYEVTQSGRVSSKYQEFYDGIAALTTWSVSLPATLNPNLLLTSVSQVKLKLKGTRVPVEPVQQNVDQGDWDSGQDKRVAKKAKARRKRGRKSRRGWIQRKGSLYSSSSRKDSEEIWHLSTINVKCRG